LVALRYSSGLPVFFFSRTAHYETSFTALRAPRRWDAAAPHGEIGTLVPSPSPGVKKPNALDSAPGLQLSLDICRLVYLYIYCQNSYCRSASPRQSCAYWRHSGAHLFWLLAVRLLTLMTTLSFPDNLLIFLQLARRHRSSGRLLIWLHVCCLVNSRPGGKVLGGRGTGTQGNNGLTTSGLSGPRDCLPEGRESKWAAPKAAFLFLPPGCREVRAWGRPALVK
jgi:hypothetical protein